MSADRKLQWEKPALIVLARNRPEEAVLCGCKTTSSMDTVSYLPFFWGHPGGHHGGHHHGGGGWGSTPITQYDNCYQKKDCSQCLLTNES